MGGCRADRPGAGRRYHAHVDVVTWIALVFLIVALGVSLGVAVVHGLRLWRAFRSFSRAAGRALDDVLGKTAKTEEHVTALAAKPELFEQATEHLQGSLAEIAALRAAASEANVVVARLRGVVPAK
jgi:hypothetical protein